MRGEACWERAEGGTEGEGGYGVPQRGRAAIL